MSDHVSDNVSEVGKSFLLSLEQFYEEMSAIRRMTPVYNKLTSNVLNIARQRMDKFVEEYAVDVSRSGDGSSSFRVPLQYIDAFSPIRKQLEDSTAFQKMFPRMALVSLVTVYDNAYGRFIKIVLQYRPEMIDSSKGLTLSEIKEMKTVSDAFVVVVDRIVDELLRESHAKQVDWVEKTMKVSLKEEKALYPQFIEVTERRNLYTHTSGEVNKQYLECCKRVGCELGDLTLGKMLEMTEAYFLSACNSLLLFGAYLGFHLWLKYVPSDNKYAFNAMNNIGLEAIAEKNYELAIRLYEIMQRNYGSHYGTEERLMMQINLAQAHKWSGDEDGCRQIVSTIEWATLSGKYKLAKSVLLDNHDEALGLIRALHQLSEVSPDDYRTWPLFRELRKNEKFDSLFQELYGEPLKVQVDRRI